MSSLTGYNVDDDERADLAGVPKELEKIDMSKLNCLHWVILAGRDDLFEELITRFFTPSAKAKDGSGANLEEYILQACLKGADTQKMFKTIILSATSMTGQFEVGSESDCFVL